MKNDVGNGVSDADGMKNIWRKYMERLLNVENDWNGEVDCLEVMGLLSYFGRRGYSSYQRIKNWKRSWSYWCGE